VTDTKTEWLCTKDIAERWKCDRQTVTLRARRATAAGLEARPSRWGRVNWWTIDQVQAIERHAGIGGMYE
jgi:hypothetical protein